MSSRIGFLQHSTAEVGADSARQRFQLEKIESRLEQQELEISTCLEDLKGDTAQQLESLQISQMLLSTHVVGLKTGCSWWISV